MLTQFEADVILHTSSNGRYVTDDPRVLEMAERGLLRDYGPQVLAGGAHYLTTTPSGRAALSEWKAAQPKPKKPKRRRSPQFTAWRDYRAAYGDLGFSEFLKTVWPERKYWLSYQ